VILDTNGNIISGFIPVKWESRRPASICDRSNWKTNESLKSFLFTLKNPHNITARRFRLKVEKKEYAIYCNSGYGPSFGRGCDLAVSDNCNVYTGSSTYLDGYYTKDIELDEKNVLTDSDSFQVEEIEVFEITA
jgi:hypothetical protein